MFLSIFQKPFSENIPCFAGIAVVFLRLFRKNIYLKNERTSITVQYSKYIGVTIIPMNIDTDMRIR